MFGFLSFFFFLLYFVLFVHFLFCFVLFFVVVFLFLIKMHFFLILSPQNNTFHNRHFTVLLNGNPRACK